jgi:hypothetical protein
MHRAVGRFARSRHFVHQPVHPCRRKLLLAVLPDDADRPAVELRAELLRVEKMLVRRRPAVEDVPFERSP